MPLRNRCTIQFSTVATKWKVEDGFFDKYQIDSCLLTRSILELKAPDDVYQVRCVSGLLIWFSLMETLPCTDCRAHAHFAMARWLLLLTARTGCILIWLAVQSRYE